MENFGNDTGKSVGQGVDKLKQGNGMLQSVKTEEAIGAVLKLLGDSAPNQ